MATHSKDDDLLPYALAGLVQRRDEIIAKIAEIRAQLAGEVIAAPGAVKTGATKKRGRRKRVLSAEAREKIAAAQRARWAATRKGAPAAKKAAKKKRTLSPEARARIAEAQRKRWAAARKS